MHKINGDLITLVLCRTAVERNVSYSKVLCTKQNVALKAAPPTIVNRVVLILDI